MITGPEGPPPRGQTAILRWKEAAAGNACLFPTVLGPFGAVRGGRAEPPGWAGPGTRGGGPGAQCGAVGPPAGAEQSPPLPVRGPPHPPRPTRSLASLFTHSTNRRTSTLCKNSAGPPLSMRELCDRQAASRDSRTGGAGSERGETSWRARAKGFPRRRPPSLVKHLLRAMRC